MGSTAMARILLCAEEPAAAADVRKFLEDAGHSVCERGLSGPEPDDLPSFGVVVLEGSRRPDAAWQFCRRLRLRLFEEFVPILFVTDDHAPATRLTSFESGADTCLLRPFAPGELLA